MDENESAAATPQEHEQENDDVEDDGAPSSPVEVDVDEELLEEEEEGEDLLDEQQYIDDYKQIDALDHYDERDLDNEEYDDMGNNDRRRAELEMRKRDRETSRRTGRRTQALLDISEDEQVSNAGKRECIVLLLLLYEQFLLNYVCLFVVCFYLGTCSSTSSYS
jgi:hypothetical protein